MSTINILPRLTASRLKYLNQRRPRWLEVLARRLKAVNRITFLWQRAHAVSTIYILSPLSGKSNSLLDSRGLFRGIQPPRGEIQSCTRSGLSHGIMALYLHARSISPFRSKGVTATDYIIFFDIKASLSAPRRKGGREGAAVSRATLMCSGR